MKTKYVFLTTMLVIMLTLTMLAQTNRKMKPKVIVKKDDISKVMGKPVYESTVDSLNTKVWIISQKSNKAMMKSATGKVMGKMKETNLKMDEATKEAVMTGTHYFIFDVTNILNKKEVADTSAKVEVVSPTKKLFSLNLQPMMNHFGGGLTLNEKGEYLFTINLNIGSSYKTTQFKYRVK